MNLILQIIIAAALLVACAPLAIVAGKHIGRRLAANTATFPEGVANLRAEEAVATRFLIGRPGTTASQVLLCDEDETPMYLIKDTATADDATAGNPLACRVLGAGQSPDRGVGSEAIAANVDVYVADGGKLQGEPAAAGSYHKVGRSVTACSGDGAEFVVTYHAPIPVTVIAALTSTNGTAAGAADLAALKTEAEKIGDDVRGIAAALATPGLVKVLEA